MVFEDSLFNGNILIYPRMIPVVMATKFGGNRLLLDSI